MDLLNTILNFLLPPLTLISLFLFFPFYLIFRLLCFVRTFRKFENVTGKVVLITGASSGIGEHVAYEYAKKGARLALVARREDRLREVAERSRGLGSSDVIIIPGDVSDMDDCKRFVHETVHHFGQLDHLVNNAGVCKTFLFENLTQIRDAFPVMNTNFWGSVYSTHYATPYLRKSKGKIIVITSLGAKTSVPLGTFYAASKAALLSFFETLSIELGPDIGVTIVVPGIISTDMTAPQFAEQYGSDFPLAESVEKCAKAIVNGVCRGMTYIVEPSWLKSLFWTKNICPEVVQWSLRYIFVNHVKPLFKSS